MHTYICEFIFNKQTNNQEDISCFLIVAATIFSSFAITLLQFNLVSHLHSILNCLFAAVSRIKKEKKRRGKNKMSAGMGRGLLAALSQRKKEQQEKEAAEEAARAHLREQQEKEKQAAEEAARAHLREQQEKEKQAAEEAARAQLREQQEKENKAAAEGEAKKSVVEKPSTLGLIRVFTDIPLIRQLNRIT